MSSTRTGSPGRTTSAPPPRWSCSRRCTSRTPSTKILPVADFFTDAAAGTLPGYSLVEPDYGNQSEENPQNIVVGEEFTSSVVSAVINGPGWDRTVLLLTYDEHGGYYDHVPPPPAIARASESWVTCSRRGARAWPGWRRSRSRLP